LIDKSRQSSSGHAQAVGSKVRAIPWKAASKRAVGRGYCAKGRMCYTSFGKRLLHVSCFLLHFWQAKWQRFHFSVPIPPGGIFIA
jgi:hypothetical protein